MSFNETFWNGDNGYGGSYKKFPHFQARARWIKDNLSGSILEVGCAHGYLLEELGALGVTAYGVDISAYAVNQKDPASDIFIGDLALIDWATRFDWVVSWNVLDCLQSDDHAKRSADTLNTISGDQLHIICMSGNHYTDQGYFIRDYSFWRSLLPSAILIDYETRKIFNPTQKIFVKIPLCWGLVSD